jgi:hypothetical protein
MNRHPVTVIAPIGLQSRCDAAWMPLLAAGPKHQVAYDHDCGRESDDTNTSGEGPG